MRAISVLAASVGILASVASVAEAQVCEFFGARCPQTSPCCNQGYCDSGGLFCGAYCDPQASFPGACYPDYPCVSYSETFDDPTKLARAQDWNGDPDGVHWISKFEPSYAAIQDGELRLWMRRDERLNSFGRVQGFGATVYNSRWFHYGTVSARVKSAAGTGVVSSFITKDDPNATVTVPDEIDFEYVGRLPSSIYTNYFAINKLDYTKGQVHSTGTDTHTDWHDLSIVWMPDYIRWLIDGRVVRTLFRNQTWDAQARAYQFPTEESRISFSIWDGGQGAAGTAEWAGGPTDWSIDPNPRYVMAVDSFTVECLSSAPTTTRLPTSSSATSSAEPTPTQSETESESAGGSSTTRRTLTRTMSGPPPATITETPYRSTITLQFASGAEEPRRMVMRGAVAAGLLALGAAAVLV